VVEEDRYLGEVVGAVFEVGSDDELEEDLEDVLGLYED